MAAYRAIGEIRPSIWHLDGPVLQSAIVPESSLALPSEAVRGEVSAPLPGTIEREDRRGGGGERSDRFGGRG